MLTTVPYGAGLRRFAHAVVRDEIYAAVDAGARERLHRRAAEVLEERDGSDPLSAGVIAGHWLRSADRQRDIAYVPNCRVPAQNT